ncbi:YbjN domain-containing protein [Clostridium perfringens]|uniref:YbjN domain-containing protein n=1 Tax=Clostridium perfringens TaxID=1502 RepID=A0AAW9INQ7_CLOPF|nr:YbjN domain-containing protein [Clostridium perfringens]MBI6078374.1 YbjN domain-containing protein [Clostridium perfringens]MBI6084011.1 YbjN domain-containing protein [Clostridium perfringens]MBI6099736.1 YbjN domain-containing protein [Clostridium perfringens]MDZ5031629.1 hypothetical protein [Clostridium perfringens]
MSYIDKKNQIIESLRKFELDGIFQLTDENNVAALFQARQTIGNGTCIISLQVSERPFTPIYFCLGQLNNLGRKEAMLELLNDFNKDNLLIKFYLDNEDIMAQVTYIATDEVFNSDEYVSLIGPSFSAISDNYYSKIMRIIWG